MEIWRNNKTGNLYNVLTMDAADATNASNGTRMVIYFREPGKMFVRQYDEFIEKFAHVGGKSEKEISMAKSKVQKAKEEQGYITKVSERPMCKNCAHKIPVMDTFKDWHGNEATYERGLKCGLGGFVVKKQAVCNMHKPEKTING